MIWTMSTNTSEFSGKSLLSFGIVTSTLNSELDTTIVVAPTILFGCKIDWHL